MTASDAGKSSAQFDLPSRQIGRLLRSRPHRRRRRWVATWRGVGCRRGLRRCDLARRQLLGVAIEHQRFDHPALPVRRQRRHLDVDGVGLHVGRRDQVQRAENSDIAKPYAQVRANSASLSGKENFWRRPHLNFGLSRVTDVDRRRTGRRRRGIATRRGVGLLARPAGTPDGEPDANRLSCFGVTPGQLPSQ